MSSDQESDNVSWGDSEDEDDDEKSIDLNKTKSDYERTESDHDKTIDLNKVDNEEETQEDEFVHMPDDYVPTNDETQDVDDEEYVRINEEMYDDLNVELKDAKLADEGKGDEEITYVEKVDAEHEKANQEVASAQVQHEAMATTTTAPATQKEKTDVPPSSSSRSVSSNDVPESETLFAIYLRVSDLEKEVKELKNVDHSTTLIAIIKSKVPTAVKEYLECLGHALQKHKALYHALMESILADEEVMDHDEDPPAGLDQGLKRRKTSKDVEPSKRSKLTDSSKGNTSSQLKPKSTSMSVHLEETFYEVEATEMTYNQGDDMGKLVDDKPTQNWLGDLAKAEKPPLTFNELMSTPIDLSAYAMNRLKISNLTKADLNNPKGDQCPFDLSKPLPLVESRGRQIILADYFFNNDLEYLRGGSTGRKYTTSITKTKDDKYDLRGIEDMNDIEDMLLLIVQNRLFNLNGDVIVDLAMALRVIYEDKLNRKRLMRVDELYKFSDSTLKSVWDTLHDMANNLRMRYNNAMPKRRWSCLDKDGLAPWLRRLINSYE
ncbi:hypothetical protein Tco_1053072, partial [Tanacetum coccineum]